MMRSNPNFNVFPFLSDNPDPQDFDKGNFKLVWTTRWHPSLIAQFAKGSFYEKAFDIPHKAVVSVSHTTFKKNTWYRITLT